MNLKGKKLLILGGTYASLNLVKLAKAMGIYTIVADYYESGVAKEAADRQVTISTTDIDALSELVHKEKIDGVFCGPSEFNIRNMIRLCEKTGLPCYTTMDLWNQCANKDVFTSTCRKYGIDVPREFDVHTGMSNSQLEALEYPIIIKPVDGSSSVGISVCHEKSQVEAAVIKALDASVSKRLIAEEYIENGGEIFGARYFVHNGEAYPYLLIDTYVADPVNRTSLISIYTQTPSKYSEYYMTHMDSHVRQMIKGMGIKSGTVFFQSLPHKGRINFLEMGYRLSGGLLYKLTEPLMGFNDMEMMIRKALGENDILPEEFEKIDILCGSRMGAQLMVPLNTGTIGKIEGLEEAKSLPQVIDFIQYYYVGSTIKKENIGTLQQHFGRFTLIADSQAQLISAVEKIQAMLKIYDTDGNEMNTLKYDVARLSSTGK